MHPLLLTILVSSWCPTSYVFNNQLFSSDTEVVKKTFQINYFGTLSATRAFLSVIRPGGRLVNVTSMAGSLSKYSPSIASRFRNAKDVDEITALLDEFTAAV